MMRSLVLSSRRLARAACEFARLAVLMWMAAACMTLHPRPVDPLDPGASPVYRVARVTLRDGTRLDLRHVRIVGDSLIGTQRRGGLGVSMAVPVASVATLQELRLAAVRTITLVVGVIALAAAVFVAVSVASLGPNY